jgi:proliferating cell nuclear antigen
MKLFSENINICFNENQLFIQAMDSSHISIIEIKIPSSWFDKYEYKENPNITIGVNTVILFKILSTRDKSQSIQLQYDTESGDILFIHYQSENKAVFDKHFEVPLIDIDSDLMEIPSTDYDADFSLSSAHFASLISNLKLFGDTLDVACSEEKITLFSRSLDSGKMSVDINIDDLNSFSINEGQDLKLSFSLNNLYNMVQFHKISSQVELKVSRDYPLNIIFRMGDENATLSMYLAPKISED